MTQTEREMIGRVLMAISNLEGIWQDEMRVPLPGRVLLVDRERRSHRWRLDERGYPIPSGQLMREIQTLLEREQHPED